MRSRMLRKITTALELQSIPVTVKTSYRCLKDLISCNYYFHRYRKSFFHLSASSYLPLAMRIPVVSATYLAIKGPKYRCLLLELDLVHVAIVPNKFPNIHYGARYSVLVTHTHRTGRMGGAYRSGTTTPTADCSNTLYV